MSELTNAVGPSPATRQPRRPLALSGRTVVRRSFAWIGSAVRSAVEEDLRERAVDVVLAATAFAALLIDPVVSHEVTGLTLLDGGLALVAAVPLVARRRYPLGVLATVVPLLFVCLFVFHPSRAAVGMVMLLVFTVGLEGHRVRSLIVGALMAPVVAAAVLVTSHRDPNAVEAIAYLALILGALAAGDAARARQVLQQTLAEEAERERAALVQHGFDQQRLRIAHELHDIVGHTLVAINVRASAAAHLARQQPAANQVVVLDELASTSAHALAEVRAALKVLRNDQIGEAPMRPTELAHLGELIAGVRRAGLAVDLKMGTAYDSIPAVVHHASFRIVQEGLTNVLRHSTAQHASVRIDRDGDSLVVEIIDDGQSRGTVTEGGHGLQGMRERAGVLGGTCEVGPTPAGGWRVRAQIPLGGVGR
jgi:signal transduction histidine kinase